MTSPQKIIEIAVDDAPPAASAIFDHVDIKLPRLSECALLLDIDGTLLDLAPTPREVWVPPDLATSMGKLLQRTNGAMALDIDALQLAGPRQALAQGSVLGQHLGIDVGNQFQQRSVLRHLGAIHLRHRFGKQRTDAVCGNEACHDRDPHVHSDYD